MTAPEIAEQLALFVAPDQVTELRAKDVGQRGRIFSGWFTGDKLQDMARHALALTRQASAVYFVPNPIAPSCGAKRLNRVLDVHRGFSLTGDADVLERRYLIVDLDPRRSRLDGDAYQENGEFPSSARELAFAHRVAVRFVVPFLADLTRSRPIVMLSGNGIHLCYRIANPPSGPSDPAARILQLVHERFGCWGVTIDPNTYNACRMLKVPGTTVRKGEVAPNRPHRVARLLDIPDGWLKPAAGSLPDPHVPRSDVEPVPARPAAGKPPAPGKPTKRIRAEPQRLFDPGPSRRPVD